MLEVGDLFERVPGESRKRQMGAVRTSFAAIAAKIADQREAAICAGSFMRIFHERFENEVA